MATERQLEEQERVATVKEFAPGDRVEVQAMCGMEPGTVATVGRKYVQVEWRQDNGAVWLKTHLPSNLTKVGATMPRPIADDCFTETCGRCRSCGHRAKALAEQAHPVVKSPHGPPPHHILIAGDTGANIVRDEVSGSVVVDVPLVKPLYLADGRHVVSIGLDADALLAMGATIERFEAEHGGIG